MTTRKLIEFRNSIEDFLKPFLKADSIPNSDELIRKLRAKKPENIREVSISLEDIAIRKFIADICGRRKRDMWTTQQNELFGGMRGLPLAITVFGTKKKAIRRPYPRATFGEVEDWLRRDESKPRSRAERHPHVASMMKDIGPFVVSRDTTIEDGYRAFKAGKKSSKKSG